MYLVTILAYALLFWRAEAPLWGDRPLVTGRAAILMIVLVQPVLLLIGARLSALRSIKVLERQAVAASTAHSSHHRAMIALRACLIVGFAWIVLGTEWPVWFWLGDVAPELQIFGDLAVLSPFILGVIAIWIGAYPVERCVRSATCTHEEPRPWSIRSYLVFNIRHQFLVVAVPLTLILFAANLADGYESRIRELIGYEFAPHVLLALVAMGVFMISPMMLRRIWHTEPLPDGPLRDRLISACERIQLHVRDILIWKSDGMMINAAVMGVIGSLRYVLLSDALLATMTPKQIEAVFAHEAGHVRHHHIPLFLTFALAAWLIVAGVMEGLALIGREFPNCAVSIGTIEIVGVVATLAIWGVGFGSISRRFERQADLFGARSAGSVAANCELPCSVHTDAGADRGQVGRVCATGAAVFASSLERVALLNGIPADEPSWRHSSIASRIRHLRELAADPGRTARFERQLKRIRVVMLSVAIIGSTIALAYWAVVREPALMRLDSVARRPATLPIASNPPSETQSSTKN